MIITEIEEAIHRAINFDLKLNLLRKYYPKKNILNAYRDIKSFMIKNGFSHRQWSGYRSNEKLTDRQIRSLMLKMRDEISWIDMLEEFRNAKRRERLS